MSATVPYPGLNAEKLLNQRVFPVCSPALARDIKEPKDIGKLPIIHDPGQMFTWKTWLDLFGLDESILQDGPTFSDGSLCLDAAIAGQGVFLAWETLAVYAVKSGQVIAPFPERPATGLGYWLISGKTAPRTTGEKGFRRLVEGRAANVDRKTEGGRCSGGLTVTIHLPPNLLFLRRHGILRSTVRSVSKDTVALLEDNGPSFETVPPRLCGPVIEDDVGGCWIRAVTTRRRGSSRKSSCSLFLLPSPRLSVEWRP